MRRLILVIVAAFMLLGSPALAREAASAAWVVSQLSGDARVVQQGLQPASLKVNSRLVPGAMVVTGATGRATLVRGGDYIVIAPRSELRLPVAPQPTGFTRVVQTLGTMLFKVRPTGVPHFAVDTPMLAAVVKGTTFTVIVDKDRSAVQVIEGAVEVAAIDGGMSRMVEGGRTVFLNHADPKQLIDTDERAPAPTSSSTPAVRIGASHAPSVAAIANLTDGLLRPEASPQATKLNASAPNALPSDSDVVRTAKPATPAPAPPVTLPVVGNPGPGAPVVSDPVLDIADSIFPPVANPVADIVVVIAPPEVDIVDVIAPPAADIVDAVAPPVVETVVNVIDTALPVVTVPVIEIVETVTDPVVDIVVAVPEPAIDVVEAVVAPVIDVVEAVVTPVIDVVEAVTPPVLDTPAALVLPAIDLVGGLD